VEEALVAAVAGGKPLALRVTELPIGRWGDAFKRSLAGLAEKGFVHDIVESSTDEVVDVTVVLSPAGAKRAATDGLTKMLRLSSRESLSNMHLFDPRGRITRYTSAAHILSHFAPARLRLYERRRSAEEARLAQDEAAAARRAAFIAAVVDGQVDIAGKPQHEVEQAVQRAVSQATEAEATADMVSDLLQLPLRSLTSEAVVKNQEQALEAAQALEAIRSTTASALWHSDLEALAQEVEDTRGHARV
jgi:DNA topoisomerase-2